MECCGSRKPDGPTVQNDDKVTLRKQEKMIRLLLLGAGDVGKSTFLRQIRYLYGKPLDPAEVTKFSAILPDNCLSSMKSLLHGATNKDVSLPKKLKKCISRVADATTLDTEVADALAKLWEHESIKELFVKRSELRIQVPSTANYYFDNVKRFAASDFGATNEDVFRCKLKTTGTQELQFEIEGNLFSITDVGGQRSERRKWLYVFSGVRAVIFFAALDEYDLFLEEDERANRFSESLELFRIISSTQFLKQSSWILFLNKSDVLREKLPRYPLNKFFSDINEKDGGNFEKAVEYMKSKYIRSWKGKTELFNFVTCSVDTDLTEKTFKSLHAMLVSDALNNAGF